MSHAPTKTVTSTYFRAAALALAEAAAVLGEFTRPPADPRGILHRIEQIDCAVEIVLGNLAQALEGETGSRSQRFEIDRLARAFAQVARQYASAATLAQRLGLTWASDPEAELIDAVARCARATVGALSSLSPPPLSGFRMELLRLVIDAERHTTRKSSDGDAFQRELRAILRALLLAGYAIPESFARRAADSMYSPRLERRK
ncbi:hypothetical protein AB0H76_35410 [Nocardia sp. NPDC050712]|uniref:hypothetical protein n=1 Tax=Nocardia sp. NPDC050712 TaxID=3155518 RepID=UPI0033CEF003